MSEAYLVWKTIHVVSATIVFGTGIGIAFFCWFGSRDALAKHDLGALRMALRFTVVADAVFTAPAVLVQFVSGAVLLDTLGWKWGSPWALSVVGLFLLVGACWLPVVWIQVQLSRLAAAVNNTGELTARFAALFRLWFGLGVVAFGAMIGILVLMVAKPLAVA
jgi:uncharacterized membrane protein